MIAEQTPSTQAAKSLEAQLVRLSAEEMAAGIRRGDYSVVEVTRAYLERIERDNPRVTAFVATNPRRSLKDAAAKDALRRKRSAGALPPFFGVPTGIKDLNVARGFPTRFGTRAYPWAHFPFDDKLTKQIRLAGFVILGKLATSEFGAMPVTEPDTHAPTRNPWDSSRSAGGSSGGSGAAVGAGLLPIAPGSDGAGSIRIPSAFNHLFGLKPSRGRVQNARNLPDRTILYTDGPLAHSVRDAALLLDALAGLTVGKPHWAPRPAAHFADTLEIPPVGLKIRVSYDHSLATTHDDIRAATREIVTLLEGLGHTVEESPWISTSLEEFLPLWQAMIANIPFLRRIDRTQPITQWLHRTGKAVSPERFESLRGKLSDDVDRWFGDADVWLSPTVSNPAPRIGLASRSETAEKAFHAAAEFGAFTAPFNVSGQPAASVPVGLTKDGLPMGVQLAAKRDQEAQLLGLCRQIEVARPWRQRTSPLFPR